MKRVVILGSTGSVGKNACRVAEALRDRVQVVGIAAKSNVGALAEQAGRLGCSHACIGDASLRDALAAALPEGCRALAGPEGLLELARLEQADMVLCAIVGILDIDISDTICDAEQAVWSRMGRVPNLSLSG